MNDTTKVNVVNVIAKKDTITLQVDKSVLKELHSKSQGSTQTLTVILPIVAALVTLALTKWFDYLFENKKFKNEILKKNRIDKVNALRQLNKLKTSIYKISLPNPELEDLYESAADKMIGVNPFLELEVNCNILFNKEINDIANRLYYDAEEIDRNFNWKKKEHPTDSITLGRKIVDDLDLIIEKISQTIKNA
jgi:hypothetical protein